MLTEVFQDKTEYIFEERTDDDYASLLWTTLTGRVLVGTVADDMRRAWTESWGQPLDSTGYIEELRLIRNGDACILSSRLADLSNTLCGNGTQVAVLCPLWLRVFKVTWFSGPHTSQTNETIFKKMDDLKFNSTSLTDAHMSGRVLYAMNNVKANQAYRKKLAATRAAAKMKLKAIETVETDNKLAKRLRASDDNSKAAVTFALEQCKKHYTTAAMADLRKRYRSETKRPDGAEGQVFVDRYMELEEKFKDKKRVRELSDITASAKSRKLEMWADKDGKWDMDIALNLIMKARTHSHTHAPTHPSTHERPQELDMNKAPLGPLGKKMTAIERNEWVQLQVDSFDAASREALTDRILMATRAKKKAKQDLKDAAAAGETGAAKPEKPRKKQKAAPAVGVTAGASFGVAVESTTVVR